MKSINSSLVKFHAALKPIRKDAQNPFFKSDYLTLSGILDAVRQPLAANGLAIVQSMRVQEATTILVTKLIHESGEEISSEMPITILTDAQKLGSLITYYKRYQLQALLGISTADEDDDANLVSAPQVNRPVNNSVNNQVSRPTFHLGDVEKKPLTGAASDAQKNALKKMGIKFKEDITKQEASELIAEANRKV